MKKHLQLLIASLVLSFISVQVGFSQDAFRSSNGWGGATWNDNDLGTNETWGGTTWDYVNSWGGATGRFFLDFTQMIRVVVIKNGVLQLI